MHGDARPDQGYGDEARFEHHLASGLHLIERKGVPADPVKDGNAFHPSSDPARLKRKLQ